MSFKVVSVFYPIWQIQFKVNFISREFSVSSLDEPPRRVFTNLPYSPYSSPTSSPRLLIQIWHYFFYKTFVLKSNIDHFLYLRVRRKPLRETNRVDSVVHEVRIFWSLWCCQQHFYCIKIFALWNELRINKKKCKVFEIKGRKDVEEKMFLRKKATNPSRIPKLFSHF